MGVAALFNGKKEGSELLLCPNPMHSCYGHASFVQQRAPEALEKAIAWCSTGPVLPACEDCAIFMHCDSKIPASSSVHNKYRKLENFPGTLYL